MDGPKQNARQFMTPVSNTYFCALLCGRVTCILFSMIAAIATCISKIPNGCWRIFTNNKMDVKVTMESKTKATMWKNIKACIRDRCQKWPRIFLGQLSRKQWPKFLFTEFWKDTYVTIFVHPFFRVGVWCFYLRWLSDGCFWSWATVQIHPALSMQEPGVQQQVEVHARRPEIKIRRLPEGPDPGDPVWATQGIHSQVPRGHPSRWGRRVCSTWWQVTVNTRY